jgi:hypothetical protein
LLVWRDTELLYKALRLSHKVSCLLINVKFISLLL